MPGAQQLSTTGSKLITGQQGTGQLANTRAKVVGKGLLLSPGLVGADLRQVPGLLAAFSPFSDLSLKAQCTPCICSEYANVLGNM